MALNETPNRLESAFIQRDAANAFYEQINISGSDLIIYHQEDGILTADKISVWAAKYGIGAGGGVSPGGSYDISASWASSSLTSSHTEFDGDRLIKRSPYTTLNVGGATVTEFLENFFFPFIPATVADTPSGTTLYQQGTNPTYTITSTVTANDEISFGTSSVKKNGADWNSSTVPPLVFAFGDSITSNHSYITYVQTDNDGSPIVINSSTINASFVYPYLWGMSAVAGLAGTSLYDAFTKQIVSSGNKTVSLIGNVTFIYFAYPATYAALSSILDPNGFETIGNFEYSSSVSVTSTGLFSNWTTNYRVYRTRLVSDPNGNYQFNQ